METEIIKKSKKGLIYGITITVLFIIATATSATMYLFYNKNHEAETDNDSTIQIEDEVYTKNDIIKLFESKYDLGYEEGKSVNNEELLGSIKSKMAGGTSTLELLRELYPESLVYSEIDGYKFMPILNVEMNEFEKGEFVIRDDNQIEYYEDGEVVSHKTIDVSKYQGDIDWEKVKNDGVEYVFIRVGLRGYGTGKIVEDTNFTKNIEGALEADLKVGVYFFTEAITTEEAIEEAEYVLERIKKYNITLPVALDLEAIGNDIGRNEYLSQDELTEVCLAFMETIEKNGYTPMLYGNIKCITSMIDYEIFSKYDLWFAFYNDDIYIPYNVSGWQYTSSGAVDGITGECDLNIFFKEWE